MCSALTAGGEKVDSAVVDHTQKRPDGGQGRDGFPNCPSSLNVQRLNFVSESIFSAAAVQLGLLVLNFTNISQVVYYFSEQNLPASSEN